jgi:hypothetical protein
LPRKHKELKNLSLSVEALGKESNKSRTVVVKSLCFVPVLQSKRTHSGFYYRSPKISLTTTQVINFCFIILLRNVIENNFVFIFNFVSSLVYYCTIILQNCNHYTITISVGIFTILFYFLLYVGIFVSFNMT